MASHDPSRTRSARRRPFNSYDHTGAPRVHRDRTMNRPGFAGGSIPREDGAMARTSKVSQEVRERAVRMVFEHRDEYGSEWQPIGSIASKIG